MHAAVSAQNVDVVRLLLERGVNASFADWQRRTPLGIARSLGNNEIAAILTNELRSKAMNISDTSAPPPNCRDPDLTTFARAARLKAKEKPVEDYILFAQSVIGSWSKQHKIFLNPDLPEFLSKQVELFREVICYPGNGSQTARLCKDLLENKSKLTSIIVDDLNDAFVAKRSATTWLAARMSSSIGIDFRRAGYVVEGPNKMRFT
jgi:hypothetical protein